MITLKDRKKIKRFLKEMPDRQKAFEKAILKNLAESVRSDIIAAAPVAPELGGYQASLAAAEVMAENAMTAVLYKGPTIVNVKKLDSELTLIFVREVQKKTPRNYEILEILKLFQPYSTKTFPGNIKSKDFVLTYQKVAKKDVVDTEKKSRDTITEMAKLLKPLGIKLEKDQYQDAKKLQLLPDLTFQVLQHELKTKKQAKPHWIPALKASQKKAFLKKLMKDDRTVSILADPNFNAYKLSGKMTLKVTAQSVQSVTDFMDYLQMTSRAKEPK